MVTRTQAGEVLEALSTLPTEKVRPVWYHIRQNVLEVGDG